MRGSTGAGYNRLLTKYRHLHADEYMNARLDLSSSCKRWQMPSRRSGEPIDHRVHTGDVHYLIVWSGWNIVRLVNYLILIVGCR